MGGRTEGAPPMGVMWTPPGMDPHFFVGSAKRFALLSGIRGAAESGEQFLIGGMTT